MHADPSNQQVVDSIVRSADLEVNEQLTIDVLHLTLVTLTVSMRTVPLLRQLPTGDTQIVIPGKGSIPICHISQNAPVLQKETVPRPSKGRNE